jgi:hypothetical protein
VGTTGIKITLPPSVVARHLAAQRQNRVDIPDLQLSSSGALMTHTAPLSALVSSSADMAARPLHEPAPFSIPRDSAAAIVAEEPTALLLSPRINETPEESGKGAGIGPFGGVPLSPASLVPPPQLVVNTNHHMQIIDVSHTLAADATVYSVLSGCTSDAQSGRLIMGTTVTKHNAAAAVSGRASEAGERATRASERSGRASERSERKQELYNCTMIDANERLTARQYRARALPARAKRAQTRARAA